MSYHDRINTLRSYGATELIGIGSATFVAQSQAAEIGAEADALVEELAQALKIVASLYPSEMESSKVAREALKKYEAAKGAK